MEIIHAIIQELEKKWHITHENTNIAHTLRIKNHNQYSHYPHLNIYYFPTSPHTLTLKRSPNGTRTTINLNHPNSIEQLEQEITKALQQ